MPYLNLKVGQAVHVTVTGVIEENLSAGAGGQYLKLRHGNDGKVLVSTIFIDDDSVDVAFDESDEPKVLTRSVTCTYGCYDPNYDWDCPVHGGKRGGA